MKLGKKEIERIKQITLTDYDFDENGETENWDAIVEDLLIEYDNLLDEYNDYKEQVLDRFGVN